MNARWLIALLVSVGCSEYEIAQGKDGENGADDTLIFPDEDTGGVDTGDFEDTEEDTDEPANDEEPPPAEAPVYAHNANALYEVEPLTGERTYLGTFSQDGTVIAESFIDIAIDLSGNMFGATFLSLYQINPTNAEVKKICDVDVEMVAMTFSSDGELFVGGSDGVQIINVVNCRTSVLTVEGGFETSGDLVGLPDGYLYWTVRGQQRDELVRVDPLSGQTSWIGSIGFSEIFGLGYDEGVLYGFNSFGETLSIEPATGEAEILVSDSGISWYGATTNPVQW